MRADRREFLSDGLRAMPALMASRGLRADAREERDRTMPASVHRFLDSKLIAESLVSR
jgi:hypothetical protein